MKTKKNQRHDENSRHHHFLSSSDSDAKKMQEPQHQTWRKSLRDAFSQTSSNQNIDFLVKR